MDDQRIFQEIRAAFRDWIRQKSTGTDKNFTLTILADQEDFLRAEFLYPDRAAELVVCADPGFAPYRHVSFEGAAIAGNSAETVFFWYDKDGDSTEEIIRQVQRSLEFMDNYSGSL